MSIFEVRRGSRVEINDDTATIENLGFEDESQRYVENHDSGHIRVLGRTRLKHTLGAQAPLTTYYHGSAIVDPLYNPHGVINQLYDTTRRRRLKVGFLRVGGAVTTSNFTEAIFEGIGQLIPFPVWGGKWVPIIEPARMEPGFFVQYSIGRFGLGSSGNTASVDESDELAISSVSIRVKFDGYVN